VLLMAWMLGAQVIEKHYTHDKTRPGNDHYHAMDPSDLARFVERTRFMETLLGSGEKHYLSSEEPARAHARRSLVAARKIPKGAVIAADDLICKRPGTGIPPTLFDHVVGGTALADIEADDVLTFDKVLLCSSGGSSRE
jgi:N-acetylneuraminate synthase